MSDSRETNVEFITRVMEFSENGALMQVFVLSALAAYSEQIMAAKNSADWDNSIIPLSSFKRCAEEFLTAYEEHVKEDKL